MDAAGVMLNVPKIKRYGMTVKQRVQAIVNTIPLKHSHTKIV